MRPRRRQTGGRRVDSKASRGQLAVWRGMNDAEDADKRIPTAGTVARERLLRRNGRSGEERAQEEEIKYKAARKRQRRCRAVGKGCSKKWYKCSQVAARRREGERGKRQEAKTEASTESQSKGEKEEREREGRREERPRRWDTNQATATAAGGCLCLCSAQSTSHSCHGTDHI